MIKLDNKILDFFDILHNTLDIKNKDEKLILLLKLLFIKREELLNYEKIYEQKYLNLYFEFQKQYGIINTIIEKEIRKKIEIELLDLKYTIKILQSEIDLIEKAIYTLQTIMKTYDMT